MWQNTFSTQTLWRVISMLMAQDVDANSDGLWGGGGGGGSGEVVYRGETSKQRKGTFQGCVVKFPSSLLHLPFDNLFSFLWTPLFCGSGTSIFEEANCGRDHFQFPCFLDSYIPSSRVDLERVIFLWDLNMPTDVDACNRAWGVHKHRQRVCVRVNCGRKIPCYTGESDLHQHHAWPLAQPAELHPCSRIIRKTQQVFCLGPPKQQTHQSITKDTFHAFSNMYPRITWVGAAFSNTT